MCKYCEQKVTLCGDVFLDIENEKCLAEGKYTSLKAGIDEDCKITLVAVGDDRAVYYPKYCPECGRNLQEKQQCTK